MTSLLRPLRRLLSPLRRVDTTLRLLSPLHLSIVLTAAFTLVVLVLLVLLALRQTTPPMRYHPAGTPSWNQSPAYIEPTPRTVCPGQPVAVVLDIDVIRVPLQLHIRYAIRQDRPDGVTVDSGDLVALLSEGRRQSPVPFAVPRTYRNSALTLPVSELPPGQYVFEVVAGDGIRAAHGFVVPFEVQACP